MKNVDMSDDFMGVADADAPLPPCGGRVSAAAFTAAQQAAEMAAIPPPTPALRLVRAETTALTLAWPWVLARPADAPPAVPEGSVWELQMQCMDDSAVAAATAVAKKNKRRKTRRTRQAGRWRLPETSMVTARPTCSSARPVLAPRTEERPS